MLCDTNNLIYAADPSDSRCVAYIERDDASIASITCIEVLGFPGWGKLADDRRTRLEEIVNSMIQFQLSDAIIRLAILLRQQKKMTLGDAVLAATALTAKLPLVTRNIDDFKHITGLQVINPFEPP